MAFTFNVTKDNNVEVLQDGKRIATTTPDNAKTQYGFQGATPNLTLPDEPQIDTNLPDVARTQGDLLSFKDTLDAVKGIAQQKRNELFLRFAQPFQGTVAASDFSGILKNLNVAGRTFEQDVLSRAVEQSTPQFDTITDAFGAVYQVKKDPTTGQIIGRPEKLFKGKNEGGSNFPAETKQNAVDLLNTANLVDGFSSDASKNIFVDALSILAKKGDTQGMAEKIVGKSIDNIRDEGVRKLVGSSFEISKALTRLQEDLKKYEELGGDTGIYKGSIQAIQEKFGTVGDKDLARIGIQIANTLDSLARLRTGAALTESEEDFYKRILPSRFKSAELNTEVINGLKSSMIGTVEDRLRFTITTEGLSKVKQELPDIFDIPTFEEVGTKVINGYTYKKDANGLWQLQE